MEDVLKGWADEQRRRGLASATIDQRRRLLQRWERYCVDVVDPGLADEATLLRFLGSLTCGTKAMAVAVSHLKTFYAWAQLAGVCSHDPTVRVERPKLARGLPRPIGRDDLRFAMIAAPPRTRLMLGLGAGAGLRCYELAGLRWDEVLLDVGQPRLHLTTTKGGRHRVVPLSAELVALLEAVELRAQWVITSEQQPLQPITAGHVSKVLARHLRSCGIDATGHQLRHLFCTVACESSDDLLAIAQMAGHASVTTTQIYAEVAGKRARTVVDAMPRIF
jgi:integrase/recombinase XerD